MKLIEFMRPALIVLDLQARSKPEAIAELARQLAETQFDWDAPALVQALMAREGLSSTGIGDGLAVPHCKFGAATRLVICFGRSTLGIDFDAPDGQPAYLVFLLVAPESMIATHLKALARVTRLGKDAGCRARLMAATTAAEVVRVLDEDDQDS